MLIFDPTMERILHSTFLIDGVPQELTPADILQECSLPGVVPAGEDGGQVADETLDITADSGRFYEMDMDSLADAVLALGRRPLPLPFAASYTAGRIARALIDAIWMGGHFRLGDLELKGEWKWNDRQMGNMAAFYASVEKAGEYMDALGLRFKELQFSVGSPSVHFKAVTNPGEEDQEEEEETLFRELPFRTAHPRISSRRRCPASILPETSDWLIYIPFDSCDYRLGGSAAAVAAASTPPTAAEVGDADYFIDCYEVVRELVEDGIVKAGATVGEGGLLPTLRTMASTTGADVSVGDICRAYGEIPLRVLFSEVPGVILQIADLDYDYIDAELLLQDVAYFPLGHPTPGSAAVSVLSSDAPGLGSILGSLLNTLEGED